MRREHRGDLLERGRGLRADPVAPRGKEDALRRHPAIPREPVVQVAPAPGHANRPDEHRVGVQRPADREEQRVAAREDRVGRVRHPLAVHVHLEVLAVRHHPDGHHRLPRSVRRPLRHRHRSLAPLGAEPRLGVLEARHRARVAPAAVIRRRRAQAHVGVAVLDARRELDGEPLGQGAGQGDPDRAVRRGAEVGAALPLHDLPVARHEVEPPREVADLVRGVVLLDQHLVPRHEVVVGPRPRARPCGAVGRVHHRRRLRGIRHRGAGVVHEDLALVVGEHDLLAAVLGLPHALRVVEGALHLAPDHPVDLLQRLGLRRLFDRLLDLLPDLRRRGGRHEERRHRREQERPRAGREPMPGHEHLCLGCRTARVAADAT